MDGKKTFPIRPCSRKDLQNHYEVSPKLLRSWMEEIFEKHPEVFARHLNGKRPRIFTPKEVAIIVKEIDEM